MTLEIRLGQIAAAALQICGRKKVLDVIYENGQGRTVTCSPGRELAAWQNALTAVVQGGNEVGTCSRCGRAGWRLDFLERGCSECGWEGSTVGQAAC